MSDAPVAPKPAAPRPPDGLPAPSRTAVYERPAPEPEGGWWVCRHAIDDRIVTSYRDRAEAEEHADRAAILFGRRVFVTHSDELP